MKSVLLSIKPKYCELIAKGKKTIEVRKSMPKLDTPFKCYIYMTKTNLVGDRKTSYYPPLLFTLENFTLCIAINQQFNKLCNNFVTFYYKQTNRTENCL